MIKFIKSLFENKRTLLKIGDKAPQSLLDKNDNIPIGAFIKVCPCCNRIDDIVSI